MTSLVSMAWVASEVWKDPMNFEEWDPLDWVLHLNFNAIKISMAYDAHFQNTMFAMAIFERDDFSPYIPCKFAREINPTLRCSVGEPADYTDAPFPITKTIFLLHGILRDGLIVKRREDDPIVLIKEINWRILTPNALSGPVGESSCDWSTLLMEQTSLFPLIRRAAQALIAQAKLPSHKAIESAEDMTEVRKELLVRALLYPQDKAGAAAVIAAEKTAGRIAMLIFEYIPYFAPAKTTLWDIHSLALPTSSRGRRKSLLHPESSVP
ncbi:MAG: hypothetical protein ACHQT8_00035 [Chlamydiales bacterium]